jgi:hypothetical protein
VAPKETRYYDRKYKYIYTGKLGFCGNCGTVKLLARWLRGNAGRRTEK